MFGREPLHRADVCRADLAQRRRRRDHEATIQEEPHDHPLGLQPRNVAREEDPIDRVDLERDPFPQQACDGGHGSCLLGAPQSGLAARPRALPTTQRRHSGRRPGHHPPPTTPAYTTATNRSRRPDAKQPTEAALPTGAPHEQGSYPAPEHARTPARPRTSNRPNPRPAV